VKAAPGAALCCLPGPASYVGGDITAGVVASGMASSENVSLLWTSHQRGTGAWEQRVACLLRLLRGPAFEERRDKNGGMRAAPGAIQQISVDKGAVSFRTIADAPAKVYAVPGFLTSPRNCSAPVSSTARGSSQEIPFRST